MGKRKKYIRNATKYVCKPWDLDKLLPSKENGKDGLKEKFQGLFSGKIAWRLHYKHTTPQLVLQRFGIDLDNPTVRDAVAFDLVKLDDGSVSNDSIYTYDEHKNYSPREYERYLLNKNWRTHLVNLDPDWSEITYARGGSGQEDSTSSSSTLNSTIDSSIDSTIDSSIDSTQPSSGNVKIKKTVEKICQGVKFSKTILRYFNQVLNANSPEGVYVPFTNANDITNEIALIPNTHPDLRPITSRAYYDKEYAKYKKLLRKYGISNIATFALVDQDKDKTHTGKFLVKVQRKIETGYLYLVAKIGLDGQFVVGEDGNTPDIQLFESKQNTILCVCEDDFNNQERTTSTEEWNPVEKDIPMVHSTTSSHYSIFRQRIPDYDLKQVRHYFQFKTRLEGMELCLLDLKRNIWRKEIRASEAFAKQTMAISRLFNEFKKNKEVVDLIRQYYKLIAEWDDLVQKGVALQEVIDEKRMLLDELRNEYKSLGNNEMDKKIALGEKIGSLKLELDKGYLNSLDAIEQRKKEIKEDVEDINSRIDNIYNGKWSDSTKSELVANWKASFTKEKKNSFKNKLKGRVDKSKEKYRSSKVDGSSLSIVESAYSNLIDDKKNETQSSLQTNSNNINGSQTLTHRDKCVFLPAEDDVDQSSHPAGPLTKIDTSKLKHLIFMTEKWRNIVFNLGYELNQLKKMLVKCEDATIKVRRLVHNFEEKMKETESQVWDENHNIRSDFSFTAIDSAGIHEIILLHDWHAANAGAKTYEEMGFKDEAEFMAFRKRCNKIAYNLRKNQYAQMIAVKRDRIRNLMLALKDKMEGDDDYLQWHDKYGKDGQVDEEEEWNINNVPDEVVERIREIVGEDGILQKVEEEQKQNQKDSRQLVKRTLTWMQHVGLASSMKEVETLVVQSKIRNSTDVNVQKELDGLDQSRKEVDVATDNMIRQRDSLQSIMDSIIKAQEKITELKEKNQRLVQGCVGEKNKQIRNRLLLDKVDNENKIVELRHVIKKAKEEHLEDFTSLEKMRKEVDNLQEKHNKKVEQFKRNIGLSQDDLDNLMVSIYNRWQDEILSVNKNEDNKK